MKKLSKLLCSMVVICTSAILCNSNASAMRKPNLNSKQCLNGFNVRQSFAYYWGHLNDFNHSDLIKIYNKVYLLERGNLPELPRQAKRDNNYLCKYIS